MTEDKDIANTLKRKIAAIPNMSSVPPEERAAKKVRKKKFRTRRRTRKRTRGWV